MTRLEERHSILMEGGTEEKFKYIDEKKFAFTHLEQTAINVFWKISDFCNYRCSYCYLTESQLSSEFLSRDHYMTIASNIVRFIKSRSIQMKTIIRFLGGEPSQNPFFEEILQYLSENLKEPISVYL